MGSESICAMRAPGAGNRQRSLTHLKAVAAILAERGELPVNVKFLVEGEEESGGESIDAYVRADAGDKLACDCVVISDTSMYAPGQPSLLYGLKGLAYMEIRVDGPGRDLHSGTFGGAVANPANALGHVISQLVVRQRLIGERGEEQKSMNKPSILCGVDFTSACDEAMRVAVEETRRRYPEVRIVGASPVNSNSVGIGRSRAL